MIGRPSAIRLRSLTAYLMFGLGAALYLSCSSDESPSAISDRADSRTEPTPNRTIAQDSLSSFLTIHGKDVWVRDSSSTGPVIMKLNDGDRCEYRETGHLEIIKGQPGYWYKVEFQGKQGWVFGAQTDWKGRNPFCEQLYWDDYIFESSNSGAETFGFGGESRAEAWAEMMKARESICGLHNARTGDDQQIGFDCKLDWDLNGSSFHESNEGGYIDETVHVSDDTIGNLWFLPTNWDRGAATQCWGNHTILGYLDKEWQLLAYIDGKYMGHISLDEDVDIFLFLNAGDCMAWPQYWGWGFSIWRMIKSRGNLQRIQVSDYLFQPEFPEDDYGDDVILREGERGQAERRMHFVRQGNSIGIEAQLGDEPAKMLWWDPRRGRFLPD